MTTWNKWILPAAVGAVGAVGAWALHDIPAAMGGKPEAEVMRRSPRFGEDGKFHNVKPRTIVQSGTLGKIARELVFGKQARHPSGPVPLVTQSPKPVEQGLHVTWYGHASTLVEIDGARVLFDPVWGERCSPSRLAGPRRLHQPPLPLEDLPKLDAIVISHDHYDHLDLPSIQILHRTQTAPFLVPLGVAAHLRRWGIEEARIVELDWNEQYETAGLRLISTAAQHFSGRGLTNDGTLWSSWTVIGPRHRVFYTGDSGYFPGYAEIGEKHGPFDAVLVQIGAYDANWPDIHMTPEEGVAAHIDVHGKLLIPVHWGTFNLGLHAWGDPVDRVWKEAVAQGVRMAVPKPGERIDVAKPPEVDGWWQKLAS